MQVGGGRGREVQCTHIIGSHDNDKFQSEGGAKLLRDFRVVQWEGNALVFDLVFPTIRNGYRQYMYLPSSTVNVRTWALCFNTYDVTTHSRFSLEGNENVAENSNYCTLHWLFSILSYCMRSSLVWISSRVVRASG